MTVQMTMEEYKELESKATKFDSIAEAVKDINALPDDKERNLRKIYELLGNLGIRIRYNI